MVGDEARGRDWRRAQGHHPCLKDTIFYLFSDLAAFQRQRRLSGWHEVEIYNFTSISLSLPSSVYCNINTPRLCERRISSVAGAHFLTTLLQLQFNTYSIV